jgi:WG containing repeat
VLPPVYDHVGFGPASQIRGTRGDASCNFHPPPPMEELFDVQGHAIGPGSFVTIRFMREGLALAVPLPPEARCNIHPSRAPVGYVDRSGRFAIAPQFDYAYDFAPNGLAGVKIGNQWGFIDKQGKVAIPARHGRIAAQFADFWSDSNHVGFGAEDLARVETDDGTQSIDAAGHPVGPGGWMSIGDFDPIGLVPVYKKRLGKDPNEIGLMDLHGKFVLAPTYDRIERFSNGYAAVEKGGQWGFIDARGELVVPLQYAWAGQFDRHGIAKVLLHPGRDPGDPKVQSLGYGFIDTRGHVVLDKDDYDWADAFQDAMDEPVARVTRAGRTGYVDTHGTLVPGWFEAGSQFGCDGLAAVETGGKFGYVDRSGRFVIPARYDVAERFDDDRAALAMLHGKWGMIDHEGKVVVPVRVRQARGLRGTGHHDGQHRPARRRHRSRWPRRRSAAAGPEARPAGRGSLTGVRPSRRRAPTPSRPAVLPCDARAGTPGSAGSAARCRTAA